MNQPQKLQTRKHAGTFWRSTSARIGELKYLYFLFKVIRSGLRVRPTFPPLVELQTINRCNATCAMCPYPETIARQQLSHISDKVYENLMQQLTQESEFKMLVLTFQNEPLLDKKLVERARRFKDLMPDKHLEIVTNGVLLTPERAEQLYEVFDLISISVNAHSSDIYSSVMGVNCFGGLNQNIEFIAKKPEWVDKTVLRFIRQEKNSHELNEFRRYWRRLGFRVFSFDINSRLQTVRNYKHLRPLRNRFERVQLQLFKWLGHFLLPHCTIPDLTSYIRSNGDVVLCFNDYSEVNLLGSINNTSLRDIYNSERSEEIRERIRCNQVKDGELCSHCDLYKEGVWLTF